MHFVETLGPLRSVNARFVGERMKVAVSTRFVAAKDDAGNVAVSLFVKKAVSRGAALASKAEFGAQTDAAWHLKNALPVE